MSGTKKITVYEKAGSIHFYAVSYTHLDVYKRQAYKCAKVIMELEQIFIALIEQSIKTNWYLNALADYKGITLQYRDVARKIEKIHILLENAGIEKGDKICLLYTSLAIGCRSIRL